MVTAQTWHWRLGLVGVLTIGEILASGDKPASAQITPDATLGTENSLVTPNTDVQGLPAELVEGGAIRGTNLFHSFLEFNIGNGQRVYFANPLGIENILSRVTGNNLSNIEGTLGVNGIANLFLLNPNGIIFGQNAQLDIAGSFVASTANSLLFENGLEFSATNPDAPPLLTISLTPGLQQGTNQPERTITNRGNLAVGQNLTLVASNLDLEGQLQAEEDLTLQALDTLKVRDSATNPFITSSEGKLLVQGNQVDIFVLNHPASGFYSGGDMNLRSPNSVIGDAHYWSGGSFQIEQLDGSLGDLESPHDPIIRASGDVNFDTYRGTSLHILAGGSVTIDSVTITGADITGNTINPNSTPILANVTLSDGTPLTINGTAQPTLDIRAGTTAFGTPGIIGTNYTTLFPLPNTTAIATGADITIGNIDITAPNGLVFLTNQYQPNTALSNGNIQVSLIETISNSGNSGDVVLNSRGDIVMPNGGAIGSSSSVGNAGDVTLIANGSFSLINGAQIRTEIVGTQQGNAGNVTIKVLDNVTISDFGTSVVGGNVNSGITTRVNQGGIGNSGNIYIQAQSLLFSNDGGITASMLGEGNAGNIVVEADDAVSLVNGGFISSSLQGGNGNGGTIQINASNSVNVSGFSLLDGSSSGLLADTESNSVGQAGSITVNTSMLRVVDGALVDASTANSSEGGNITINSDSLELTGGGQVFSVTRGIGSTGSAGDVNLNITGAITVSGSDPTFISRFLQSPNEVTNIGSASGIFTSAHLGSTGNGGNLSVNTSQLNVTDEGQVFTGTFLGSEGDGGDLFVNTSQLNVSQGGIVSTSALGRGSAGDLFITATESINVVNSNSFVTTSALNSTGDSGNLSISTAQLNVSDGGTVATTSFSTGDAGNLLVTATESVSVSNQGLISTGTDSTSTGDGGNLSIYTRQLDISNGENEVGLSTAALGTGNAGNLSIVATDSMNVVNQSNVTTSSTQGVAGSLDIETGTLNIRDNSFVVSDTFGSGDAGNLSIRATDSVEVVDGSKLSANTFGSGNGGDLTIETGNLSVQNGGEVSTVVTTDSAGNAGSLTVRAADSIEVDGSKLATETYGSGDGGDLIIETGNLSVQNRGEVSTGVFENSSGQAGNLSVTALDSVELVGGNLATATLGAGGAGDLTVTTQRLTAQDGGRVEAGTLGIGQGGNVTVNASESIDLSGFYAEGDILVFSGVSAKSGNSGNGGSGNVNLTTGELIVQDGAEIASATLGAGEGGDIQVQANSVSISNGGSITSRSTGEGNSGNVQVQANSLSLSNSGRIISRSEGQGLAGGIELRLQDTLQTNGGEISASSDQSGGGDINISARDIFLRNGSLISSSVFDSTGGGGNITINSSEIFLALEDSDILANAEAGSGGNITINSPGFLADLFSSGSATPVGRNPGSFAQFRGNGRVDISAESQTGSSGRVTFPNIDPSRGAVSLPTDIVDASGLISSGCGTPQKVARSRFIVSGRGGLPPTPSEILSSDTVWTDLRSTIGTTENRSAQPLATQPTDSSPKPLVEAQGWMINPNGQVILTAQALNVASYKPGLTFPSCQDSLTTSQ